MEQSPVGPMVSKSVQTTRTQMGSALTVLKPGDFAEMAEVLSKVSDALQSGRLPEPAAASSGAEATSVEQ